MHKQEVCGISLLTLHLRDAGSHGNSRNSGRADKGIDLALGDDAHDLSGDKTSAGRDRERNETEADDSDGLGLQEVLSRSGSADRNSEEYRDDIHKLVLSRLGKAVSNARDIQEISEHQESDERSGFGKNNRDDDSDEHREDDLLGP